MSLSAAQLIASLEVCGEALRRLRVARDLTQAKRLQPMPRRDRLGLRLHAVAMLLPASPPGKLRQLIATRNTKAERWPQVNAG
jgi:hypothetical protein